MTGNSDACPHDWCRSWYNKRTLPRQECEMSALWEKDFHETTYCFSFARNSALYQL